MGIMNKEIPQKIQTIFLNQNQTQHKLSVWDSKLSENNS